MDLFAYANEVAPTLLINEPVAAPAPRIAPILAAVDVLTEAIGKSDFSRQILDNIMTEAFGGTDASGAWTVQQAYNALEGALVKRLLATESQPQYDDIMTLLGRLPAQNRRTADKDELQQFSTPPTIGLVAAQLAQVSPHDTVLEPSVGTGLLGLFAAHAGATMVINEIDPERLRIARHVLQPAHAHGFDGRYISIYGKRLGAAPSLVLMNPPFSSDGGAGHSSEIGLAHVYQAASVLRPGGRLVTILAEFQHPELRPDLWTKVQELCSLRAAYMVAPREYHKLGTDYGVCVVMLDKRLGLETVEINATPTSVKDLLKALPNIGRQDVGSIRFVDTSRAAIDIRKREIRTYSADFPEVEALVYQSAAPAERNDEGIFVQYAPYLDIEGAQPHPEALVESAALACVRPPVPTVDVRLPKGVRDRLSVAQLESIIYAANAHSQHVDLVFEDDSADTTIVKSRKGIMFGHGTGYGKGRAQPLDAPVLTPSGWTTMGALRVGDLVIAADGSATPVLALHPQGVKPIYRMEFSDGTSTECTEDHLWLTQSRRQRYYEKHRLGVTYPEPKLRTTAEIRDTLSLIHSIPLVNVVHFEPQDVPVEPYLLGALLADGSLRMRSAELVSADEEILEYVRASLPTPLKLLKKASRTFHYGITKGTATWKGFDRESNAVVRALRDLGLAGKTAQNKFIPDRYKFNTVECRVAMLQGLMDCDGHASKNGCAVYYTVSNALADDIVFLVQSLGGIVTRSIKKTAGLPCHVLFLRLPAGVNPFRLSRKAKRIPATWTKYPPRRYIKSVELVGEREAQCITIAHCAHLYVTNDFIVTHNCMAGIIASNFAEGRGKAMWFSENQTLCEDAQRDIVDVLGSEHSYALFNVSDFPANVDIEREHGILYSTYATLRSEGRQDTRSRLEQIATWAGANFDGVIIFDESHNLANATEGEGSRGKTKASKQAIAAVQLQRRFPKARIVYTSATSASKIDAFLYAPRLGLFGPNTAFPTQAQFVQQLGSGGTAAMELLCRDAKALGVYLATNLSMAGVTYERLEHVMTSEQIEQYDAIAEAWLIIDREAKRILDLTDAGGMAKGAALSKLESTRLRCLQSVLVTAKLPTVLEHSSQALENGKAPVFQLTNTYEAAQERALARLTEDDGADLEDLDLSPKEQIFAYLDQAFPVTQYVQRNVNGKLISEPMVDTDGSQIANPEAIQARENLKAKIASLIIPMSPLDIIIDHFGSETIAEVTGRKRRVISKEDDGERKRVIEPRNEHTNSAETEAFMQGKKRALIFSEGAGGTGRSYHASLKCQNQDQRWQYLAQTGWRSDKAVQGFPGRTHRTFQACAPHGILCSTDAPGEKRFLSTIARRLEELGACTRGQRDAAGTGVFSASDNLETEYAFTAITALLHRIAAGKCDEIPYEEWMEYTNFPLTDERDGKEKQITLSVPRFLNKMLASPLWFQKKLMELFLSQLDATVEAAKGAGTFDTGIETLDALSIGIVKRQAIYEDPNSGAKTELVTLEAEYKTKTTSFGTALSRVREQRERYTSFQSGFVKSDTGSIYAVYPIGNTWVDNRGAAKPYWKLVSPTRMETLQERPGYGYMHVTDDDAAELWAAEFEAIGETVKVPVYIVSGTLLPVYDRLPNDQGKVMRVTMDNGERIIGRVIKEAELQMFLQRFNIDAQPEVSEIVSRLHNRATVRLTNSYVLRKVRFMDDARIECIVPRHLAMTAASTLRSFGLIHERVNYEHRFFLPVGNEEEVLSKLLERNKVAQVAAAA